MLLAHRTDIQPVEEIGIAVFVVSPHGTSARPEQYLQVLCGLPSDPGGPGGSGKGEEHRGCLAGPRHSMKEPAAVALEVIELGDLDPPGEGTEHENRDQHAGHWAEPVDPPSVPTPRDQRGTERAGGIR